MVRILTRMYCWPVHFRNDPKHGSIRAPPKNIHEIFIPPQNINFSDPHKKYWNSSFLTPQKCSEPAYIWKYHSSPPPPPPPHTHTHTHTSHYLTHVYEMNVFEVYEFAGIFSIPLVYEYVGFNFTYTYTCTNTGGSSASRWVLIKQTFCKSYYL